MERRGEQVVENETEATGASKEGVVRWVLMIGLLLAIIALSVIWITGALSKGPVEEEGSVGGKIAVQKDAAENDVSTAPPYGDETPVDTTVSPAPSDGAQGTSAP